MKIVPIIDCDFPPKATPPPLRNENRELLPMEIKAARSYNPDFTGAITKFRSMVPNSKPGAVIYSGDLTPAIQDTRFVNFIDTAAIITA